MNSEITVKNNIFDEVKKEKKPIHLVLIATKPDIIKLAPLIIELKKENEFVLTVHSGQHFDWNLSGGLEEEFGLSPDINLNVRGMLFEQQAQIIERLGKVLFKMKKLNKRIIPYILGDTTTAVAGGIASFANLLGTVHVEAGLRTMTPPKKRFFELLSNFDAEEFYFKLREASGWKKGSYEPYPEQFDTRAAAPSAGLHFSPTPLNKKHLLDEGYDAERIVTVGNPVSDAIDLVEKKGKESNVFEMFPLLEEGEWIRFCIHRRENVSSLHRFSSLIEAIEKLVNRGEKILLVSLGATEKALNDFGLKKKIEKMSKSNKNFIYSPVWPYYRDAIAVMKKCSAVATDSGSIQEETNILGVPGIVLRFNSDRPEAVFAGSNTLAPPINAEIVEKIVREVVENKKLNKQMRKTQKLYGKNVCKKIVKNAKEVSAKEGLFELFEQQRLGLTKLDFWKKGETQW